MPKKAPRKKWYEAERRPDDVVMKDPREDDIVIPIMGLPGVGKSTFINAALSREAASIEHSLAKVGEAEYTSVTVSSIEHFVFDHPRDSTRRIVFVETPGFDDSFSDGYEILRRTAVWLAKSYSDEMKVAGVVYLHDISQTRMTGTFNRHLSLFQKLCGDDALRNVILVTTKWDIISDTDGLRREQQLAQTFWKPLLDLQARMGRFKVSEQHAVWDIINLILEGPLLPKPFRCLKIQEELVELRRMLPRTEAAQQLRLTLKELQEKQAEILRQLSGSNDSKIAQRALEAKVKETTKKIDDLLQEGPSIGQRIKQALTTFKAKLQHYLAVGQTPAPHRLDPSPVSPQPMDPQSNMSSHSLQSSSLQSSTPLSELLRPGSPQHHPSPPTSLDFQTDGSPPALSQKPKQTGLQPSIIAAPQPLIDTPIITIPQRSLPSHVIQSPPSAVSSVNTIKYQTQFDLLIMAWFADHEKPRRVTVTVRRGARVCLEDFRQQICDQHVDIEVYDVESDQWFPALWDTPILIKRVGQLILIRRKGVSQIAGWEINKPFFLQSVS